MYFMRVLLIATVLILQGCGWVDLEKRWSEMKMEVGLPTGSNVPVHKFIRGDKPFKSGMGGDVDEDEDEYF